MPNRERPKKYVLDGYPIYYTFEKHTTPYKINTHVPSSIYKIKLTFRKKKSKISAGSPDYGKILYFQLLDCPCHEKSPLEEIHHFIALHSIRFWASAFHSDTSIFDSWLDAKSGLPLVIAWAIDREPLSKTEAWAKSTYQKKNQIMTRLLAEDWRGLPIGQLNASVYGPSMTDQYSKSTHKLSISLLNQILNFEKLNHRLSMDVPILKLPHRGKAASSSSTSLIRQHIRCNTLTREQICKLIATNCTELSKHVASTYRLACLLAVSMAIPMEELCYLRLSHIVCDKNQLPVLIRIEGHRVLKNKNFSDMPYRESSSHYRILPIPHKLAIVLHPIIEVRFRDLSEEMLKKQYFFTHPQNLERACQPNRIIHWINSTFKSECLGPPVLNEVGLRIPSAQQLSPYKKIYKTANHAFYHNGFEEDEFNYYFGLSQKSVAGKTYCDFASAGEQRRMAQIIDMRLPAPPVTLLSDCSPAHISNPSKGHTLTYLCQGTATILQLELSFPPLTDDAPITSPYRLDLSVRGGFSASATFTPHTK